MSVRCGRGSGAGIIAFYINTIVTVVNIVIIVNITVINIVYNPNKTLVLSIANLAKGALGGGVLSAHGAYMRAGFASAIFLNFGFGIYLGFCFYLLAKSVQIMCRRCQVSHMTYPDVAEAAVGLHSNKSLNRYAFCMRVYVDFITCMNLFGSCASYQLIVGKTIKQLAENSLKQEVRGLNGMPDLQVYVAIMIVPTILICLINNMKYLAYFSVAANVFVALAIIFAIYYARYYNPKFENMVPYTDFRSQFLYVGMAVFSMSCAGVVLPVENSLINPRQMKYVMIIGYVLIISSVFLCGFFGYTAFLSECKSPITINFPMDTLALMLKAGVGFMIYVTHAVNFFMPFNCCFYYIKKKIKPENQFKYELLYRAIFVAVISFLAILFPNIDAIIGFLGCFCLSNMAFICPNVVYILVCWERPGLGQMKWRLWRAGVFIAIGIFILLCGTWVSFMELIEEFQLPFQL